MNHRFPAGPAALKDRLADGVKPPAVCDAAVAGFRQAAACLKYSTNGNFQAENFSRLKFCSFRHIVFLSIRRAMHAARTLVLRCKVSVKVLRKFNKRTNADRTRARSFLLRFR